MRANYRKQQSKTCRLTVRCLLFLSACFFFALAPLQANASDAAPGNADRELLARDLRLTVSARQAIQGDQELAPSNIGVSVRQGVATLWGKVASETIARRALDRLRAVPGLVSVRSELLIGLPDDLPPHVPLPVAPIRFHPAEKMPLLAGSAPLEPANDSTTPPRLTPAVQESVVVMPAIPLPKPAPTATSVSRDVPTDLPHEVSRLRRSSGRYQGIEFMVKDGNVYLRGSVQRGEDLTELAQAISRLPGVERVIVGDVRIEQKK